LNEQPALASNSGDARQLWVWRLSKIIEKANLFTPVHADAGKTDKQSSFVKLVGELQASLPQGCRRQTDSQAALADAISEAQSRFQMTAPSHAN
jgi:hypothetical protein